MISEAIEYLEKRIRLYETIYTDRWGWRTIMEELRKSKTKLQEIEVNWDYEYIIKRLDRILEILEELKNEKHNSRIL